MMSQFDLVNISSHSHLLRNDERVLTYKSSDGAECQDDYILVSSGIHVKHGSCEVERLFDNMTAAIDHSPITATVRIPVEQGATMRRFKQCNYDRAGVHDPGKTRVFRNLLMQRPSIPWPVEASSHQEIVLEWIWDALETSFPVDCKAKRVHSISDGHFQLIKQRALLRARASWIGKGIKHALRRAALLAWRHGCIPWPRDPVRDFARADWCWDHAFAHDALFKLSRDIAAARLNDLADMLDKKADYIASNIANGNCHEAFSRIRWFSRERRQPKQRATKPCGETATSAMEELEAFRDHDAKKLTGQVVTYGSMVQRDRDETPAWVELCRDTLSSVDHPTSLPELKRGCSRRKLHRSSGMDCLGGEVVRLFSSEIAEVFYPVFLKTTIKFDLPLRWRGGRAVDLFKSGDTKLMRNLRELFLRDELGKVGESNLRRGMRPILEKATLDTQLGDGFHDGACDKTHLALRAAADCASIRKQALAALFLDVTGAFLQRCSEHSFLKFQILMKFWRQRSGVLTLRMLKLAKSCKVSPTCPRGMKQVAVVSSCCKSAMPIV